MSTEPNGVVPFPRPPQQRGNAERLRTYPDPDLDPAAAAVHPAYEHLYRAFRYFGGSASAAHQEVASWWDEARDGPLPNARATRAWAEQDHWRTRMLSEIYTLRDYTTAEAQIELESLRNLANHTLREAMLGNLPKDLAASMVRAAQTTLYLVGSGTASSRPITIDVDALRGQLDGGEADAALSVEQIAARSGADYQRARNASS